MRDWIIFMLVFVASLWIGVMFGIAGERQWQSQRLDSDKHAVYLRYDPSNRNDGIELLYNPLTGECRVVNTSEKEVRLLAKGCGNGGKRK